MPLSRVSTQARNQNFLQCPAQSAKQHQVNFVVTVCVCYFDLNLNLGECMLKRFWVQVCSNRLEISFAGHCQREFKKSKIGLIRQIRNTY
jgi:hypothetical protein